MTANTVVEERARVVSDVAVSVVIAAHNRGETVGQAIDGVLRQTHRPAEILVVDDGSTDDVVRLLTPYGASVRLVRQERQGRVAAWNRGVELARSPWVALVEFDAPWCDDHLERLAQAVDATRGQAGFYFRDAERTATDGGGSLWSATGFTCDGAHTFVSDATDWTLARQQPMTLGAAIIDRDAFLAAGGMDGRLPRRHAADLFLKLGVGRTACAVGGLGARAITPTDSRDAIRRTDRESVAYWLGTVGMYRSALRLVSGATRRLDLRHRLAAAHWRLFRVHAQAGRVTCALWQLLRSGLVSPSVPFHALARWLRRRRHARHRVAGG